MTLAEVKRPKPFEVMLRSAVIGFAVASSGHDITQQGTRQLGSTGALGRLGSVALSAYAVWLLYLIGPVRRDDFWPAGRSGHRTILWYRIIFGITTFTVITPQTGVAAEITPFSNLKAFWLNFRAPVCSGLTRLVR